MPDTQIHIYSVDTGHFYSNHEKYLHERNCRRRKELSQLKERLAALEAQPEADSHSLEACQKYRTLLAHKREKIKASKEQLLALLANKAAQNQSSNGRHHTRQLRKQDLHDTNVVSVFTSALTRAMGLISDDLTDTLFLVQVYYFDVFRDLSCYGFTYQGEAYRYFTSSAGQIRQKKALFIKASVWAAIEKTIMCGLTLQRINLRGGNNVNKHLAYLALSNSAADAWKDFDIDRCIVVEDFETEVPGTFDFIDEKDYSITRKTGTIPITHTDGAGMMLPSVSSRNTMFRAPWIKGLLGVFDFRKFISQGNYSPVLTDIYGHEHHILEEDIQIIFTKSQFKMYKFYDSWEEYKNFFKKYNCQAGRLNTEEAYIKPAKINYQMLQTLTDVSDEELDLLAEKSVRKLNRICESSATMLETLGVAPWNAHLSPFQASLKRYPSLLLDTYVKDILREVKNSLVQKYRSGKLEIEGKFTFILPDFYAACEHWFGKNPAPRGLLADGEVSCRLYRTSDKLNCLRSPHLYKEHAIRRNVAAKSYGERANAIGQWFCTDALYTSTHDLISKLLQFDVDGDKSLVVANADFIAIAERNMKDVVPLYYQMKKAEPAKLTSQAIFEGLRAAFTGGNIGIYSNNISKIWNHEVFQTGTEAEKQHAMDCVKRLCCQNNFVIDFAKTLYKPEFPVEIGKEITKFTNCKLPAFFTYAKDKEASQVEAPNESLVNRLRTRIPDKPINTRHLQLEPLDYRKLMACPDVCCAKEVAQLYDRLNREYRYKINHRKEEDGNLPYIACCVRQKFESLGYSKEVITDMLVAYLYGGNKRSKQLLWLCFGEFIAANLQKNVPAKSTRTIACEDCGALFEVDAKNHVTSRCPACYQNFRKKYKAQQERNRRQRKQLESAT